MEAAAAQTPSLVNLLGSAVEIGSALKADGVHYVAVFMREEALVAGKYFTKVGNDGVSRVLVQLKVAGGRFEYLYQQAKTGWELMHQMFVSGGKANGNLIKL